MSDELLTIQDVASRLKLAERTVYAMAAEREMPAFKVRGQWRVRRSDFERWLDSIARGIQPENTFIDASEAQESPVPDPSTSALEAAPELANALAIKPLTERRSQAGLHERFVEALGGRVVRHSQMTVRPLELDLSSPLPSRVRVYLFNATRPPGGRPLGEHKIQLIMPGQRRGERASFDHGDGRIVLMVGYAAEEDVFVLWDAGLYADFAWSRNVQVRAETIVEASAGKLAVQQRILRPAGRPPVTETLLAAPAARLPEALQRRARLTRERMARD